MYSKKHAVCEKLFKTLYWKYSTGKQGVFLKIKKAILLQKVSKNRKFFT